MNLADSLTRGDCIKREAVNPDINPDRAKGIEE